MDDDTGSQTRPSLWIDWVGHIVSFHPEEGYQRLEFPSDREKMAYAVETSSRGFRIQ